jgi:hypothetical protein
MGVVIEGSFPKTVAHSLALYSAMASDENRGTRRMNDDYRAGLQVLYDGEVMGERLSLALYAAARTPQAAEHFAAILQLETETKARLRPLLLKYGMNLAEAADLSGIPARLAGYADQTWRDYTAATASRLTRVLRDYEAIAALGPPEDQPILQAVVAHEAALLEWARAEAAGETDQSLAAITGLLCFPPTASA